MVAVRMVSEGVNIPRIRVIVYLTNIVSELFFMQAMGRAMRVESDHDDPTAWVYIPDDERLHSFARAMMDAIDKPLMQHEKRQKQERDIDAQPSLFYDPISSTSEEVEATVGGLDITAFELSYAKTFGLSNKAMAKLSPEHIAAVLKASNFDFASHQYTYAPPQQKVKTKAFFEELEDIKKRNNKLAARIHYTRNIEYPEVNYRLNLAVGIGSVKQCADLEKLEHRYSIGVRWFRDGTEPEVPFND